MIVIDWRTKECVTYLVQLCTFQINTVKYIHCKMYTTIGFVRAAWADRWVDRDWQLYAKSTCEYVNIKM